MRVIVGLALAFVLGSCATAGQQVAAAPPPAPIKCFDKAQCDAKWSRAITWIATNSSWKIQTQTDFLVQTYNSIDDSPSPSFTVTKVAKGAPNSYEITFTGGCANILGCIPSVAESRASFTEFVNAGSAGASNTGATAASFSPEQGPQPRSAASDVHWRRSDGRKISGNPLLEREDRTNRANCEAQARAAAEPGDAETSDQTFIRCRKQAGYEISHS